MCTNAIERPETLGKWWRKWCNSNLLRELAAADFYSLPFEAIAVGGAEGDVPLFVEPMS
jgi:hypothetical protein